MEYENMRMPELKSLTRERKFEKLFSDEKS